MATSLRAAFWVVNPRRFAAAIPDGKTVLSFEASSLICGRVGLAFAEGGIAGAVIDALAQPLDLALLGQAGKGLRDGRNRKVAEIPEPPQPLSAGLDTLADKGHDVFGAPGSIAFPYPYIKDGPFRGDVKFYCNKTLHLTLSDYIELQYLTKERTMSDGPHRSLPMRRPWKSVAECADNVAFEVDEIREVILPALENDCRREMRREFLDNLRGLCADQEAMLFKSDMRPLLEGIKANGECGAGTPRPRPCNTRGRERKQRTRRRRKSARPSAQGPGGERHQASGRALFAEIKCEARAQRQEPHGTSCQRRTDIDRVARTSAQRQAKGHGTQTVETARAG